MKPHLDLGQGIMLKSIFDAAHSNSVHMHVLQLLQSPDQRQTACVGKQEGRFGCV